MSSKILRRAAVQTAPLLIDNALAVPFDPDEATLLLDGDLVQALQQENPDAGPDEIEDVLQEVMQQLRQTSADAELPLDGEHVAGLTGEDAVAAQAPEVAEAPPEQDGGEPAEDAGQVLRDSAAEAAAILENARREAQQILTQADDRAAEIEKAAYDKGYGQGLDAGTSEGQARAADMMKQAVAVVDQATALHDSMLGEAEAEMVALCLEIARKVIHTEVLSNSDVVTSVVNDAVKRINGSPRVTIKVNPEQLESVQSHWAAAFGPSYREKEWVIEPDASVEPGGCVLDTRYGSIDARIGTQFSEIQKTFTLLLGTAG